MSRSTLSVVIPSRTQPSQLAFLERAIASINAQTAFNRYSIVIIIGVDKGQGHFLRELATRCALTIAESNDTHSHAAALNAAIRQVQSEFVAFLEDDDEWSPQFLSLAEKCVSAGARFVSSTQLEFDEFNAIVRINDFPTPAAWFMPADTLNRVGEFDETYCFHLDNEWLGRLSEANVRRCHLVEMTAPLDPVLVRQVRPWLFNVLNNGGRFSGLARHDSPLPLVRRLVHSVSAMTGIARDPVLRKISDNEYQRLVSSFGRVPW